jgi:4-hydroxy-3-methylbut-2-enyl diphosphate reductase
MIVEIEPHSGFCSGVKRVVSLAETELNEGKSLECLGEIVHNQAEVDRLSKSGMNTLKTEQISSIENSNILIRAHGEPASTYDALEKGHNRIIDGTCPVVLQVQKKLREAYKACKLVKGNVIIYGKSSHPEVIGLLGQIYNDAVTVTSSDDLGEFDFSKPVYLFSQTTMPLEGYNQIRDYISSKMEAFFPKDKLPLNVYDTICRQVSNRVPQLKEFARNYDVIVFVGGIKSSNGKVLYNACLSENPKSYFVSEPKGIDPAWFENANSVGICGATSTPLWQMELVKNHILTL